MIKLAIGLRRLASWLGTPSDPPGGPSATKLPPFTVGSVIFDAAVEMSRFIQQEVRTEVDDADAIWSADRYLAQMRLTGEITAESFDRIRVVYSRVCVRRIEEAHAAAIYLEDYGTVARSDGRRKSESRLRAAINSAKARRLLGHQQHEELMQAYRRLKALEDSGVTACQSRTRASQSPS